MIIDNSKIRRQDRLMSPQDAEQLLRNGEYGVLAMTEQSETDVLPYAVPISYVWNGDDTIYMHCATEGHKLEALDANPMACFVVVGRTEVNAKEFTTAYSSLIVRGRIERGLTDEEKVKALELFLKKYAPDNVERGLKAASHSLYRTEILRLHISSVSAKQKTLNQKSKTRLTDGV